MVTTCSKRTENKEKKNIKNEGSIKTLPMYLVKHHKEKNLNEYITKGNRANKRGNNPI